MGGWLDGWLALGGWLACLHAWELSGEVDRS